MDTARMMMTLPRLGRWFLNRVIVQYGKRQTIVMLATNHLVPPCCDTIVAFAEKAIVTLTVAIHTSYRILVMIQMSQNEYAMDANDDLWNTILPSESQ